MSCHCCRSNFGLFRREYGCTHCGFSFCGKCCSNKIIIPSIDAKKKKLVCKSCHERIISEKSEKEAMGSSSPPLAFKKRLEALSRKSLQGRNENVPEHSNEKDQMISTRLDQLKHQQSIGYGVTQVELEERLAKLKGIDPKIYTAPPIMVYREPGSHSVADKAEDLIKQYQEEVEIDSRQQVSTDEEIEARLARLKGLEPKPKAKETVVPEDLVASTEKISELGFEDMKTLLSKDAEAAEAIAKKEITDFESDKEVQSEIARIQNRNGKEKAVGYSSEEDDDDVDDVADNIVAKFVAEVTLDEACAKDSVTTGKKDKSREDVGSLEEESVDELPWCVICNEDAQLRCVECEKDLFCLRCFKECHETFDMTNHQIVLCKPPPKQLV